MKTKIKYFYDLSYESVKRQVLNNRRKYRKKIKNEIRINGINAIVPIKDCSIYF